VLRSAATLCLAKCIPLEEGAQKLVGEVSGVMQLVRQSRLTSTWLLQAGA